MSHSIECFLLLSIYLKSSQFYISTPLNMISLYLESTFQLPVDGHLSCFPVRDIVKMAMNMTEHASLCQKIESFGLMPRTGIAQSYNSPISILIEEAPHCVCTNLHSFLELL